jgi:predicted esterase
MKTLQDFKETTWNFNVPFSFSGIIKEPQNPKSVILLLHGLNERGRRIYRKLGRFLPEHSLILAPNAPFPLSIGLELGSGYAWYFYDKSNQTYPIGPELSCQLLTSLLAQYNPQKLPVHIIGFSQGGYLAPQVAFHDINVVSVTGIGCEFRKRFFQNVPHFELHSVHGEQDQVIPLQNALNEISYLKEIGAKIKFTSCPGGHEINNQMAEHIREYLELKNGKDCLSR